MAYKGASQTTKNSPPTQPAMKSLQNFNGSLPVSIRTEQRRMLTPSHSSDCSEVGSRGTVQMKLKWFIHEQVLNNKQNTIIKNGSFHTKKLKTLTEFV